MQREIKNKNLINAWYYRHSINLEGVCGTIVAKLRLIYNLNESDLFIIAENNNAILRLVEQAKKELESIEFAVALCNTAIGDYKRGLKADAQNAAKEAENKKAAKAAVRSRKTSRKKK